MRQKSKGQRFGPNRAWRWMSKWTPKRTLGAPLILSYSSPIPCSRRDGTISRWTSENQPTGMRLKNPQNIWEAKCRFLGKLCYKGKRQKSRILVLPTCWWRLPIDALCQILCWCILLLFRGSRTSDHRWWPQIPDLELKSIILLAFTAVSISDSM